MKGIKNKATFCCSNMSFNVLVQSNLHLEAHPNPNKALSSHSIVYDPVEREFWCYLVEKGTTFEDAVLQIISYCPFCGAKLPKSLECEYLIELEKTLGRKGYEALFYYEEKGDFKEVPVLDRKKVPEEFKTDEWWINRGYGGENVEDITENIKSVVKHAEDQLMVYPTSRDADAFISGLEDLGVLEKLADADNNDNEVVNNDSK